MSEQVMKCSKMCLAATTHDANERQIGLLYASFLIFVGITLG